MDRPKFPHISKLWQYIGLSVLVIAVAATVFQAARPPAAPAASESRFVTPTPPPTTRATVSAYVIGDSITGGAGTGGSPFTPGQQMATALNWNVQSDGIGGSGFVSFGRQLDTQSEVDRSLSQRLQPVLDAAPDVVIVAAGRNDSGEDLGIVQERIWSFLSDLRAGLPEAKIVVISPWLWSLPEEASVTEPLEKITTELRNASSALGAVFIDSRAELWRVDQSNLATMTSADGWHPNQAGYKALGTTLAQTLVEHGLPRGPERWQEVSPLSYEWHDPSDAYFMPVN